MSEFGEWITWGKRHRPDGLHDMQRIQVVFINANGALVVDEGTRSVGAHSWVGHGIKSITLAYRLQRETHVLYGTIGGSFCSDFVGDQKLTYFVDDGEVVGCKMEKV